MLFNTVVSAALLAQVLALPALHQHHKHEKRAVHVVTKTNIVVVTVGPDGQPHTTEAPAAPAPAPEPTTADAPAAEVTTATTVAPDSEQAKAALGIHFSAAASVGVTIGKQPAPASSSASQPTSAPSVGSGGSKGITYTPYSDEGGCKSSSQIASELSQLTGYDLIRLYGTDCDQVAQVLKYKASHQKVFAGIFDVSQISSNCQTIADAVNAHGSWSDIDTVSVGNELVNNGQCSPDQIKSYVDQTKSAMKGHGYSGPIVSVDTFIAVINNPSLCQYSDYIAVNAHAFFDGHYTADQAGSWLLSQIQRVSTACGNSKRVLITESGWPSKGDSNGVAVPSKQNQDAAIQSIKSTCGDATILFTAFNDLWKHDGPYNAEKYWGFLSN
ncbi:uncharacterized protein LODBEIA_P37990 [Lodderomyces beijingensis]|uniref:Uncharacterized protein n=1 Tax=Lodderomyces beijingensis TaxID=1775926 RepID=A0ABP0ZQW2_9ASCO